MRKCGITGETLAYKLDPTTVYQIVSNFEYLYWVAKLRVFCV